MMSKFDNERANYSQIDNQQYLNCLGHLTSKIAFNNDLYASVMIAQALLESGWGNSKLAQAPNYNLFGVKANRDRNVVTYWTQENNKIGDNYQIISNFQKYDSYNDSIEDYVKLLRLGLHDDTNFYANTWRSRTQSYRDVTDFLGKKYATDKNYANKLNYLIKKYNLTKFDQLNFGDELELNEIDQAPIFVVK